MRLRWLRTALRNLDEKADYIAAEDSAAARLVVGRIHSAVAQLVNNPAMGRPAVWPAPVNWSFTRTRYIVTIAFAAAEFQLLRVFHTSRKPPAKW